MPTPLPAPDYLRADLTFIDPATGARRAVTVVVSDAMIWPLTGESTDRRFAGRDLTPLVPVVVAVRVEGMQPESEESVG